MIHAVGPRYRDGKHGEPEQLANAHRNSLALAAQLGIKTLSFPSIGTGAYGYPLTGAARIGLETAIDFLKAHPEIILVRFVLFGQAAYLAYVAVLNDLLPAAS